MSALFLRCGKERSTKRGAIECKVLVFLPTFLQAQPTPRPLEARPAESHIRSEGDISKTVSQKKAVMVAKDVAAVLVFYWALSIAPLSIGVVWCQRETHSQACHAEAGFDLDGFVTVWDEG